MNAWNVLDAELVDTLQSECMKRGKATQFRTAETTRSYPLPISRAKPLLICPFCGRRRCEEHADLPALDPHFNA
jgi:hypothetical protein